MPKRRADILFDPSLPCGSMPARLVGADLRRAQGRGCSVPSAATVALARPGVSDVQACVAIAPFKEGAVRDDRTTMIIRARP